MFLPHSCWNLNPRHHVLNVVIIQHRNVQIEVMLPSFCIHFQGLLAVQGLLLVAMVLVSALDIFSGILHHNSEMK